VQRIEQNPHGVLVSTARGEIHCKRVIVTIPSPLYRSICFNPPLPVEKLQLSKQNRSGYTNKVIVLYHEPWWRSVGCCGLIQSFVGPVAVSRDSSVDETGQFSLTCFLVGKPGLELSKISQEARFGVVVAHIERVFKPFTKVPTPKTVVEYEWYNDQWAQGCPCPASPPGVLTRYGSALRAPHHKVHFAGTETAYEWKGYMEGALRSGKRGAAEIVSALCEARL
jgi:monoamine oxidase